MLPIATLFVFRVLCSLNTFALLHPFTAWCIVLWEQCCILIIFILTSAPVTGLYTALPVLGVVTYFREHCYVVVKLFFLFEIHW
jgi:hypothetical protein